MKLEITNFRSIKRQVIELAPITVVYGANGAGKSSLLYALLTLKNIILNPNQNLSGFFNYAFASLGGYEAVVFDHQIRNDIELSIVIEQIGKLEKLDTLERNRNFVRYQVSIGDNRGKFALYVDGHDYSKTTFQLPISFPYAVTEQTQQTVTFDQKPFGVTWDGIRAYVHLTELNHAAQKEVGRLVTFLNTPVEKLRMVGVIPLKRGFSKPLYSAVPVTPMINTEDEVATLLSTEKYLVSKVSYYLEQVLGRDFRVNVKPGTAIFSLDSSDKKTGLASELVNEGFGINQIVYFLTRCLYHDTELVCVEEPEIHLHPSAVRGLAKMLVQICHDVRKAVCRFYAQ